MSNRQSNAISVVALVVAIAALCLGPAAGAVDQLVNSGDIQNGSIKSTDLAKNAVKAPDIASNAVKSTDIGNGAVQTSDIGEGEVQPGDLELPAPQEVKDATSTVVNPQDTSFVLMQHVSDYDKKDATSILQVDWTGTVEGHNGGNASGCVFQIRVDGQPAAGGGGEVFGAGMVSVTATGLFPGLPPGPHKIELWAKLALQAPNMGAEFDQCTINPQDAGGLPQSLRFSEIIV